MTLGGSAFWVVVVDRQVSKKKNTSKAKFLVRKPKAVAVPLYHINYTILFLSIVIFTFVKLKGLVSSNLIF